jgi:hypothetical protein
MRALVLDGDGSVRQTDSHPPPIRVSGEARIAMRLAGICDTDLQLARGYLQYQGVLGHEFVVVATSSTRACWATSSWARSWSAIRRSGEDAAWLRTSTPVAASAQTAGTQAGTTVSGDRCWESSAATELSQKKS